MTAAGGSGGAVAVFGSSTVTPSEPEWADAEWLGERLAAAGWTVVNGGYGGVMEAVSAGARRAGGQVIGVTAPEVFPQRDAPNPYLTNEAPASTIPLRIAGLLERADAVIALPGSIGTLAELVQAWNVNFVSRFGGTAPLTVIAVGAAWADIITSLEARLGIPIGLVSLVPTAEEALQRCLSMLDR